MMMQPEVQFQDMYVESPPNFVYVQPRVIVRPPETVVVRKPPVYFYGHRHCHGRGCWTYYNYDNDDFYGD